MRPEATTLATPVALPLATPDAPASPLPQLGAPAGNGGVPWLDVFGIVLLSALLWTGLRKVELSGYWKGVLALFDLALLAYAVFGLGWTRALVIVAAVNAAFFLVRWARFVIQHDDVMAHAATVSGSTKPEMKSLATRLRQDHRVFRYLGPMRTAKLIDHLSDAARSIPEIEAMATPIAHLWVMDRPDMSRFVADFDRLLRLWKKPADEAAAVADVIAAAAQKSPMTIQETINAMIAFKEA